MLSETRYAVANGARVASDWTGPLIRLDGISFTGLLACFLVWRRCPGIMTRAVVTDSISLPSPQSGDRNLDGHVGLEIYPGDDLFPWHTHDQLPAETRLDLKLSTGSDLVSWYI